MNSIKLEVKKLNIEIAKKKKLFEEHMADINNMKKQMTNFNHRGNEFMDEDQPNEGERPGSNSTKQRDQSKGSLNIAGSNGVNS